MKTVPTIMSSNLINRYNMMFPVQTLESALRQSWNRPLPSSVGHDTHRPAGWSNALALHLQPQLSRLFGAINYAEDAADLKAVEQVLHQSIRHHRAQLDQTKVADLRQRLGGHLSAKAELHAQGCASFIDRGVAARFAPKLFDGRDDDTLFKMSALTPVAPGVPTRSSRAVFPKRATCRHSATLWNLPDC